MSSSTDSTVGGRFDCLENRMNELEDEWLAEAEMRLANNELEADIVNLQEGRAIDQELRALKDERRS
jgi:hypothetical protein